MCLRSKVEAFAGLVNLDTLREQLVDHELSGQPVMLIGRNDVGGRFTRGARSVWRLALR